MWLLELGSALLHKGASGQVQMQQQSPDDRQLMELAVRYVLNGLQVLLAVFQVKQQSYPPSLNPLHLLHLGDHHLVHLHGV